jgi:acyl-coenzyme A thioesterase PaaI-like protein
MPVRAAKAPNPRGTVHGDWALTLIDSATGCACYSLMGPDTGYATVEAKGNLSRPILHNTGRVRAEVRVIARGSRSCRPRHVCSPRATASSSRTAPRP